MLARLTTCCALALAASGVCAQPLPPGQPQTAQLALPNPAAVNCEKLGGHHVIRKTPGGDVGMCVFKDGRACDAWALYRDDRCVGAGAPRRVSQ
ncbi:protein of unknown function DUF333 [Burkholderia sp. lig30]|jgi:putative hemolysin|uniref:putative hemolysin n=1 Tax=Burkholderia sp. lig30 TaxID=1192124 RepID=UPI000460BABB|nr:DUF333 domain-containing protein [Burkholderia sp. lig30]KDB10061.1 protein of unknown function DUF333 [Burkholderia sp. lig30]